MEPIDEEVADLVNLEDVSQFEHTHDSVEHLGNANDDNLEQLTLREEPTVPNLLIDWIIWLNVTIHLKLKIKYVCITIDKGEIYYKTP